MKTSDEWLQDIRKLAKGLSDVSVDAFPMIEILQTTQHVISV